MSTCYIDTDGEIERLQSITAELVAALDTLLQYGNVSGEKQIKAEQKAIKALERAKQ